MKSIFGFVQRKSNENINYYLYFCIKTKKETYFCWREFSFFIYMHVTSKNKCMHVGCFQACMLLCLLLIMLAESAFVNAVTSNTCKSIPEAQKNTSEILAALWHEIQNAQIDVYVNGLQKNID
jgi:hypothetical protein